MKVALWSLNLARKITSVDDWLSLLEEQLISVQQQQVDILVLPEYLSEHFLSISRQINIAILIPLYSISCTVFPAVNNQPPTSFSPGVKHSLSWY